MNIGPFNISTTQSRCIIGSFEWPEGVQRFSGTHTVNGMVICEDDTSAPVLRSTQALGLDASESGVQVYVAPRLWTQIANATSVSLHVVPAPFPYLGWQ